MRRLLIKTIRRLAYDAIERIGLKQRDAAAALAVVTHRVARGTEYSRVEMRD